MKIVNKSLVSLGWMARVLKVETRWLKTEADAGKLPHLKAGNRYLFEPETVKAILIKRAMQATGGSNDQ